jgi:predicted nucleotidyltransferase
MKTTNEYLDILSQYKQKHASEYGIERMGIFGSVARGEQTDNSDVDVCIESPSMSLFALSGLYLNLEKLLGTPVDIVRMHKNMNPHFKQRIEKEAIYV